MKFANYDDNVLQVQRLRHACDLVRQHNKACFDRNNRIYDARVREIQLSLGQLA